MLPPQKFVDHPVHIYGADGQFYPTALIPFCKFGGNMSVMGVKIDQFDDPVCNSFRPKIIRDQLCYTVDPNKFKDQIDIKGKLSISLYIHYNEERQMEDIESTEEKIVIVDTIGKTIHCNILMTVGSASDFRLRPPCWLFLCPW